MKALSLFSGIGGIDLAGEWAGIETVAFCEREPFCQKVLNKHWPHVPIYDDVCTLTKERLIEDGIGTIDLIHGGYPCQPFSHAGKREGENDDRHLWPEVRRLIETIKPRWFVGENVAGHVTLGLDDVLSDLGNIGYTAQPFIIPACAVDARHRRDRVFIVANANSARFEEQHTTTFTERTGLDTRIPVTTNVSDTASERLSFGGRSQRTESSTEDQTRMESEFERRGEVVAYPGGGRYGVQEEQIRTRWDSFKHGGIWTVEPDVGRVANGIPHRVDRLKALGNAVVPQQIYPILAAIKQIDDMLKEMSA
ncbi:DNA cytosine methyltransferase [Paenibacillus alkalitolerans]|uniref:DNA cytosine methyltransferase n=1 Tax=Paenibacillus alkalitolerans TaxID=2799335 RepID=UPI0018F4827F|nr:DNA cytosine methyltransferase [Paenibacillus alkalitolerans]